MFHLGSLLYKLTLHFCSWHLHALPMFFKEVWGLLDPSNHWHRRCQAKRINTKLPQLHSKHLLFWSPLITHLFSGTGARTWHEGVWKTLHLKSTSDSWSLPTICYHNYITNKTLVASMVLVPSCACATCWEHRLVFVHHFTRGFTNDAWQALRGLPQR